MKKTVKEYIVYIVIFAVSAAALFFFIVGSALVPDSAVRDNILSSADYFAEEEVFFDRIEGIPSTRVDNYADAITVSIAWGFSPDDPFASTMKDSFYYSDPGMVNSTMREYITNDAKPQGEYMRYWHGSSAVTRLMHTFTDINGMRVWAAVTIYVLAAALILLLVINKRIAEAGCTVLALASAGIWFVPDTIQNVWCPVIMLAVSIICCACAFGGKYGAIPAVLLVSGIVTNFLDFLTTETLTLLFPLLLTLSIKRKDGDKLKDDILWTVKCCVLWLAGYGLMWVTKWICAAAVLNTDVLSCVTGHITERLYDSRELNLASFISGALHNNIWGLFPLGYKEPGLIAAIIIIVALAFVVFVFRSGCSDKGIILLFLALGAVVYIRYLVLANHSYLHYFFVFRSQASSVLAVLLTVCEVTGLRRSEKSQTSL